MQASIDTFVYHLINKQLIEQAMLRFKIKEAIAKKEFAEDRRIPIGEVATESGVHRMTLSKMINQRGYVTKTETLDKLCEYFQCAIGDLVEFISNNDIQSK